MLSLNSAPPRVLLGALSDTEEDCACPAPPVPAYHVFDYGALYTQSAELFCLPLHEDWTLVCNTLAGGAPAVLNAAALSALNEFGVPRQLVGALDQQLAEAHLIDPVGTRYAAPTGQPTTLTAWLHITNACNLDCPYCYVRKSAAKMTFETGVRAIDSLIATARQHGFTTLKLKYAGGEAALHYRLVQRLHAYASAQAELYNLTLQAVVLSNGTVIPLAFADWLADFGVRLMLSVDGVGSEHDLQRPWKGGGGGAFAALERNLIERLLPRAIRPDICITVTGRTAHEAQAAVGWALHYDLPFSLNFYRENEQSARHRDLRFEEQQIIDGLLGAYELIEHELPNRPFLNGLLDRVQAQAHGHTCGVGQSYVVITHTGQVAQCQMELQSAQPFNAKSDLIQLVSAGAIHNVSVDEKEGCRSCAWRYRCAGGCPIVTLRATGRTDIKSPNCAIYQALLPAALRLEGLRLLKSQGLLVA
jgi:uncharacterized protein